jgi:hypothetical protein
VLHADCDYGPALVLQAAAPLKAAAGFVATCTWTVRGSVGHWGHIHQRTNKYKARITVKPIDGDWKITELQVLQEERVG